jgi:phage terminase Nu1 subunit (DNA packaging protein)
MNQVQFAKEMGYSKGYVTQLKQAGRLVFKKDGQIDAEASKLKIAATADPNRDDVTKRHAEAKKNPQNKKPSASDMTFSEGRAKEQHFKALQAELEYQKTIGALVDIEEMRNAVADVVTVFRQTIENVPHSVGAELVGKDIEFIRARLKQAVNEALSEMERNFNEKIKERGAE